jgi:hypothetical protein
MLINTLKILPVRIRQELDNRWFVENIQGQRVTLSYITQSAAIDEVSRMAIIHSLVLEWINN